LREKIWIFPQKMGKIAIIQNIGNSAVGIPHFCSHLILPSYNSASTESRIVILGL
jgi:hypothetical protein